MSEYVEDQPLVVELISEEDIASRGKVDYKIFTVIKPSTETPDTYKANLYFSTVNTLLEAKDKDIPLTFTEALMMNGLKLNIAIGGRGRVDLIHAELARKGIPVSQSNLIPKPTLYDKIMRRDLVRKYESQEAENMNLE